MDTEMAGLFLPLVCKFLEWTLKWPMAQNCTLLVCFETASRPNFAIPVWKAKMTVTSIRGGPTIPQAGRLMLSIIVLPASWQGVRFMQNLD